MMGPSKDSHRLLRTIRRRKAPIGKPQQLGSCDGRWQRLNSGVSYRLRFCSEAAGCHPFQPKNYWFASATEPWAAVTNRQSVGLPAPAPVVGDANVGRASGLP
jgi:hypothetical protein